MLIQDLYSVQIEALPMHLPPEVTVDVSALTSPDMAISAQDIPLPQGVSLVTPPAAPVVRIGAQRAAVEPEPEGAEAAEAAGREEAPAPSEEAEGEE